LSPPCREPTPFDLPLRRFERIARARPGATALELGGETLTYGELDRRAQRLARWLVWRGVTRETPVAVHVAPSFDVVVAMLAIWKAGGVYVPLDPSHPRAHVQAFVDEVRPAIVLSRRPLGEGPTFGPPGHWLDDDVPDVGDALAPSIDPEQAAYILQTSGTTGRPKSVVATHANLAFHVGSAAERFGFSSDDTFCSLARTTFSISFFELVSPLACGGRLVLLERSHVLDPARLARALRRVTVVHAGPSLLRGLFRHLETLPAAERTFPGMRHASSGGDVVSGDVVERMKSAFPGAEPWILYGCTEIACMGSAYRVPRDRVVETTLVGTPFRDVGVALLDDRGRPVRAGEIGEIHVAGPGLCRGYLNRPELDAARFVVVDGRRHYATGDLAQRDASGNLELLGRHDHQVKRHGIRIELGEIELALRRQPGVRDAVVVLRSPKDGEPMLVAYLVGDGLVASVLRRALRATLPDSMVPTDFVMLDRLPLTANLKVDRAALPDVERAPEPVAEQGVAGQVGRVFARFLGVEAVGPDDDFFALGGNSLLALRVTDELSVSFREALPLGLLFQCPTPRKVAERFGTDGAFEVRPIPLNENHEGPVVFLLSAVHAYRPLARLLEPDCAVHALSIDRDLPGEAPISLEALAAEYTRAIVRAQPRGPYRVGGYSFGGIVALEVARRLRERGAAVQHVWLLDSMLPRPDDDWLSRLKRLVRTRPAERDGDPVVARDRRRTQAYLEAVSAHRLTRYDGAATLIASAPRLAGDPARDPTGGWSRHLGDLAVAPVDAGHHDLLSAPAVHAVAAAFRTPLAR
jgi:amino acid adenylation domain-containing protein